MEFTVLTQVFYKLGRLLQIPRNPDLLEKTEGYMAEFVTD